MKKAFLATTALLAAGNAFAADVAVYGQVNKLIMGVDNGAETNTAIVDNDASSTRFGFKAQQQLENGLVVSGLLELQSESNSSSAVTMDDDNNDEGSSISERHSRIGLGTKYGTFLIGKTSEATDGITEIDLGAATDVLYADVTAIGGAVDFVKSSDETTSGSSISDLYSTFDGGRTNLVRYDTPIVNGVSGSTSISSGGDFGVAAKYSAKFADRWNVKAGVGYKNFASSDVIDNQVSGSATVKCDVTDLAATFAMGERSYKDGARDNANFLYTKLSYLPTESNFEYAVDYAQSESVSADKQELDAYGAAVQYNIAKGVSTSVMYRNIQADNLAEEVEDIQVMTAGLKVKF